MGPRTETGQRHGSESGSPQKRFRIMDFDIHDPAERRAPDQPSIDKAMEDKTRGYREVLETVKSIIHKQSVFITIQASNAAGCGKRPLHTTDIPEEKKHKEGLLAGIRLKTPQNVTTSLFNWRELQSLRDPALTGK